MNYGKMVKIAKKLEDTESMESGKLFDLISKIIENSVLVNQVIDYRSKRTINMFNTNTVSTKQVLTDIEILKILQIQKFDFSTLTVDFDVLIDKYKEAMGDHYKIHLDLDHVMYPATELEIIKQQEKVKEDLYNMMESEEVENEDVKKM